MELTDEQRQAIIDEAMEGVRKAVVDKAVSSATWDVERVIAAEVKAIIKDFTSTEIAPEIVASLTANKSGILDAAICAAEGMAVQLASAMTSALAKNLGTSYQRKKIIDAMFD